MTICCNAEAIVVWFGDYMTIKPKLLLSKWNQRDKLKTT